MKAKAIEFANKLLSAITGMFGFGPVDINKWWDETGKPAITAWWDKNGVLEISNALTNVLVGIGAAALTQTLGAVKKWWDDQDFGLPTLVKAIGGLFTLGILMKYAGKLAGVGGKPGPKNAARGLTRGLVARMGMAGLIAGWGAGLVLLGLGSASIIVDNIAARHKAGETGLWAKFNALIYGGDAEGGVSNAMKTGMGLAGSLAFAGLYGWLKAQPELLQEHSSG